MKVLLVRKKRVIYLLYNQRQVNLLLLQQIPQLDPCIIHFEDCPTFHNIPPPPPQLCGWWSQNKRKKEKKTKNNKNQKTVAIFAVGGCRINILYILISDLAEPMWNGKQHVLTSWVIKFWASEVLTNNFCILWNNAVLPVIESKSLQQVFQVQFRSYRYIKMSRFFTAKLLNNPAYRSCTGW